MTDNALSQSCCSQLQPEMAGGWDVFTSDDVRQILSSELRFARCFGWAVFHAC